jgi:hypothetical protein
MYNANILGLLLNDTFNDVNISVDDWITNDCWRFGKMKIDKENKILGEIPT